MNKTLPDPLTFENEFVTVSAKDPKVRITVKYVVTKDIDHNSLH